MMRRFLAVVVVVLVGLTTSLGQVNPSAGYPPPQPPPLANNGYPQVQSSHCRYLVNAPSPWGTNASPFKLYTRSYSGEVKRGNPIEMSILPYYEAFKYFNFTDFACWAEPHSIFGMRRPEPNPNAVEWGGGAAAPFPGPPSVTHLGVWKVYPQYAGGAEKMKCNMYSTGDDTVGTFQGRMMELLKTQFPFDPRLQNFVPSARHGAAFLWYPDERTMRTANAIKFVCNLKSFGQWFKLESTPWRVHRPPPRRPMRPRQPPQDPQVALEKTLEMMQQARALERKLEQSGAPGI